MNSKIVAKITLSALIFCACIHAQAITFSNVALLGSGISSLGAPDTTSYGETLTTSFEGVLQDFSFYATAGNNGNVGLIIATWDGSKAIGPALYTSSPIAYSGGVQTLVANEINLTLLVGVKYIAFLTTAGIDNPISSVTMQGSTADAGLGGKFAYLNSDGANPLDLNGAWNHHSVSNMAYTANITPVVPEPETYGMMLAGLGLIGFMARRKAKSS
ncbi:FxDxF family PEP-CTERM protein [Janthinobacterium rivuli]|uniref:FxDxF family PEP-CTERM protein n=1 Tax=Janthinobacterium rivuli TaxID=2751478 RepID=A0ABY8HY60_9BURK|nr:FxDxF family PEP-CTERM protein [Janthinobacterium rivuli]WFR77564.1 FxDxF family PEP-CTERM protein [Janthinobacterium rivuli]